MQLILPEFLTSVFDKNIDVIIRVDSQRPLLEIKNFTATQSLILEFKREKWIALDFTGVETEISSLKDLLGLCYSLSKTMSTIPKKSDNFLDHIDDNWKKLLDENSIY